MPRRYLHPDEARDLRIMGQGDQIEIDENGEDFIDYTSSESSSSEEDDTDFLERIWRQREANGRGVQWLLNMRSLNAAETPEERAQRILQGDFYGIDVRNLSEIETQALETFTRNFAERNFRSLHRPDPRRTYRQFSVPNCVQQPQLLQPEPEPENVNLLQVEPEEVNQQLLELAFAESPEVNIPELMQLLGAPGDPGDPDNGSVVVNDCDDEGPDLKHFTVMGGGRKRKSRSRKRNKETKSKRKSKRKTRKRKSNR